MSALLSAQAVTTVKPKPKRHSGDGCRRVQKLIGHIPEITSDNVGIELVIGRDGKLKHKPKVKAPVLTSVSRLTVKAVQSAWAYLYPSRYRGIKNTETDAKQRSTIETYLVKLSTRDYAWMAVDDHAPEKDIAKRARLTRAVLYALGLNSRPATARDAVSAIRNLGLAPFTREAEKIAQAVQRREGELLETIRQALVSLNAQV